MRDMKSILITGVAGFVGSHIAERLVAKGYRVVGLDNFDDYYPADVKRRNLSALEIKQDFQLCEGDIRDSHLLERLFSENDFDTVIHLAARAGVRPSLEQPLLYQDVNVKGTMNLLGASRVHHVGKFLFASSSSVYGCSDVTPFDEGINVNQPISPYAASKAAAELFCYTYYHLYGLPMMMLRIFTVYGPRQRPEMAIHRFVTLVDRGEEVTIFGDGSSKRDYTFINDIVDGFEAALCSEGMNFHIVNLGAGKTVELSYLLHLIEEGLGKKARIRHMALQPGDVPITSADISKAHSILGYEPKVSIEEGVFCFIQWYLENRK